MAEAVLFNVARDILMKLGCQTLQEIGLWWGVQDEVDKLKSTVSTIQAMLLDAEKLYSKSNQVREWLDQLKEVVYDADDLLDDFSTEAMRLQVMPGHMVVKEVRHFFSSSNQFAYGLKIAHKIKDIREKLYLIVANKNFHLEETLEETDHSMANNKEESHSVLPEVVIGREEDKKKIVDLVLSDRYEQKVVVIPIIGMGGQGKTTLAQLVYNEKIVQTQFELKLWVCVPENFNVQLMVENMLEAITGEKKHKGLHMNTLTTHLRKEISGKKYLLVLDDVWNEERRKWLDFKDLIKDGARGSRIIVTTRLHNVAKVTSLVEPHKLAGLSKDESWDLFKQMAFREGHVPTTKFEELGQEIVKKCCGVPLAIRSIGSLLYSKEREFEWESIKTELFLNQDLKMNGVIDTLKLSYNHLPSNLKHCFAYCSLFPKDHKFDVLTLINLWKGQCYIQPSYQGQSHYEVGMNYFTNLLQRSFFQEIERDKIGNIVRCKMHDLIHDLAISVAGRECVILSNTNAFHVEKARHFSIPYSSDLPKIPPPLYKARKARTFLRPNNYLLSIDEKEVRAIISNLKYLHVLDLHRIDIQKVPYPIHKLKHLRHLDLSYNYNLKVLPDSITRLQNLQVLNLNSCVNLQQLPKDINKLVNLEHLDLEDCDSLNHMPHGLGKLISLEFLPVFIVAEDKSAAKGSYGLSELQGLNKLKGSLHIANLRYLKNMASECKAANMKEKAHLQSLWLDWSSDNQDDDCEEETALEALEPTNNLKKLIVYDYSGVKFPSWLSSLTNLVTLDLNYCEGFKSLPRLDKLPSLQDMWIIGLEELEYIEDDDLAKIGEVEFFPSLKRLKLKYCPNLNGWWRRRNTGASPAASSSPITREELPHFPRLSEVEIDNCPNLTSVPLLLPSIVEHLSLEGCKANLMGQIMSSVTQLSSSNTPPRHSLSSISSSSPSRPTLYIAAIQDLEFLSKELMQNLPFLKSLEIDNCPRLRTLSPGIRHLTFLEKFKIIDCSVLESWVDKDDGHHCEQWRCLPSLKKLIISGCPILSERCRSNTGIDWPKIAHIPSIKIT